MKNINYKKIVIIFFLLCFFIGPVVNLAQAGSLKQLFNDSLNKTAGDNGAGYTSVPTGQTIESNLLGKIAKYIGIGLSLLGVIFLILMIYGGFKWMMARGNESEVQKAKDIITHASIGLVLIVSAYAISYLVFSILDKSALK